MNLRFLPVAVLLMLLGSFSYATQHTITNSGFVFMPGTLNVTVGDTVNFDIGGTHNAVEVSESTYNSRGTTSNGGFNVPFGGGQIVITEAKTYYYVCQPHVNFDMIGIIVATEAEMPQKGEVFVTHLSGRNEALPTLSTGSGMLTATLDSNTLVVEGSFSNLIGDFNVEIAGGSHIHKGLAGQNGGVEVVLTPSLDEDLKGGSFAAADNTFELTEEQIQLLKTRQMYVNIHSTTVPSGEIRGQLIPQASMVYSTNAFGSNEVPAVMSSGAGAIIAEVKGDSLYVSGSFSGLEGDLAPIGETGIHLHMGKAGRNGGISFVLTPTQDTNLTEATIEIANNGFAITDDQKAAFEARDMYVNIHTTKVGSGEIRGQLAGPGNAIFRAGLSGMNEPNPAVTAATGSVLLELDGNTLTVSGTFNNLSSALATDIAGGAHIHMGMAGSNGGVVFILTSTTNEDGTTGEFAAADNVFELTDEQVMDLMARRYYVNIHSLNFGGGELRGQIVPESQILFSGFLTGMQEADPVLTIAGGAVVGEVMGNQLTVSGSFNNLSSPIDTTILGGAHLHLALAGSNGPVAFLLASKRSEDNLSGSFQSAENAFDLTDGLLDTLRARSFYVNIHSENFGSGELRSQLLPEATLYFMAPLSGANETTPVNTPAKGAVIFEWNNGNLKASGSFAGLQSDFNTELAGGAHLHMGKAGQNGGILYLLNSESNEDNRGASFPVSMNNNTVSEAFPDTILARNIYVNIHSVDVASGEIRGQIMPFATAYFTTQLNGFNEVQPVVTDGAGALSLELNGNTLTTTGSFSGLTGDFNAEVGGGAHL
ncbi:MAG: CHRD domain-containing protein, partial [Bacteroidota bacterium]